MSGIGQSLSPKKRSKSGCVACRQRRIKCDEQKPTCGRCCRLAITCSKPPPQEPLQKRRQGLGSIKRRLNWKPRRIASNNQVGQDAAILSRPQSDQAVSQCSLLDIAPTMSASPAALSSGDYTSLNLPDVLGSHWPFSKPTIQTVPEVYTANTSSSLVVEDWWQTAAQPCESAADFFMPETMSPTCVIQSIDRLSAETNDAITLSSPESLQPHVLSSSVNQFPSSSTLEFPELDLGERNALDYYRLVFSPSRTVRGFSCSSFSIFLRMGAHKKVVLHFILALSLDGVKRIEGSEIAQSPNEHLNKGITLLRQGLMSGPHDEHECASILAAAWLFMIFMLECDVSAEIYSHLHWLRLALVRFLKMHKLYSLKERLPSSPSRDSNGEFCGSATRSFTAKIVCLIVAADVQLDLRRYEGCLAQLFGQDASNIYEFAQASEGYLQLNHGSEYPATAAMYDIEAAECSRRYLSLHLLYHNINRLFWKGLGDYNALEKRIDALEKKYASFFHIAKSPYPDTGASHSRLRFQIDALVTELNAIRIYLFRCRDQEPTDNERTAILSYLHIRHRMHQHGVQFSWFNRSFFIVGSEVDDPIHRDWILDRITSPELKRTLLEVWKEQSKKGRRLLAAELRGILQSPGSALTDTRVTTGDFNWIE